MSIVWKGMDDLAAALESRLKPETAKKLVRYHGAKLQEGAMRNAPVKTGFLKRSIMLSIEDKGYTAKVSASADYAPYVEYGTRFMNAQPFMRPAFNRQSRQFANDLKKLTK